MNRSTPVTMTLIALSTGAAAPALAADNASELLLGNAPILFTQGKDGGILLDGTVATTDEIYLWVPALDGSGDVDLGSTGGFFRIWDSGSTDGAPNNVALGGNDDEDNEMRGLHFDPAGGGSFLISYDDSSTTGFVAEASIPDGNLLRITPTAAFANGEMQDFLLASELVEGANGAAGNFAATDLYGFAIAPDGTFYWGSGSATLATTTGGSVAKGSNEFVCTEGFSSPVGSPRNIGDTVFYDSNISPPGFVFPTFINGQGRGVEVLADDSILISVSDTYNYPNATDTGVDVVLDRWDIGEIDPVDFSIDVIYPGELFFETIDTTTSEMLGFDVLDSQTELAAFVTMIGAGSDPGMALQPFLAAAGPCNAADLSAPFGTLNVDDIDAFVTAFLAGDLAADLDGSGSLNVDDIDAFVAAFLGGCP